METIARRICFLAILLLPSSLWASVSQGSIETKNGGIGSVNIISGGAGSITIVGAQTMDAPTGFSITATSQTISTATWNAVLNPNATSYTLQYSGTSDFASIVSASNTLNTTAMVSGLTANTQYYARVKGNENGPWSVTAATMTPAAAAPTDIVILQSTGASTHVSGPVNSMSIEMASAPRSGGMFFLLAQSYAAGGDEPLNTPTGYSSVGSYNTGNLWMYVYNKRNYGVSVGSDTLTTVSGDPAYMTVAMVEYSTTSNTVGGFASANGTGTSASVNVDVVGTGCVVMGLQDHNGDTTSQTAANSFVLRHQVSESALAINEAFIDYASGSNINTGTYTPTLTLGASRDWIMLGWYLCQ